MGQRGRFQGRTAAVTGAGGFIGNAIVRRLVAEGAGVRGLDANAATARRVQDAGADFIAVDVTDRDALPPALDGVELVVHTAALVREWGPMDDFVRVNVGGTVAVLDAARAAGAERVAHISSIAVHGYEGPSAQAEDAFRRTCGSPYIDTKSASDRIACERGAVVVRPGDVYGPGGTQWVLRPLGLARAGRLAVPRAGGGIMLPVYVDDLVEATLLALERGEPGRPYVAWDGSPISFEDYLARIARLAGATGVRRLPRPVLVGAGAAMAGAARLLGGQPAMSARAVTFVDRRGTVSTRRIREELGWTPAIALEEGLRRVEVWLRAEGLL